MDARSEVPPDTLPVELTPDGVEVTYQDGRRVFYRGVPAKASGSVTTAPGKDVHVLVTDADERRGVLVYVNERKTEDSILEDTGVGRVLLDAGEETTVFPGVTVRERQMRVEIEADPAVVDGRVFVFEEDEMGERSFELVPDGAAEGGRAGHTSDGDDEAGDEDEAEAGDEDEAGDGADRDAGTGN